MTDPLDQLRRAAEGRTSAGLRRTLRPRDVRDDVLDLASNDYLGLARDPRVTEAAAAAARGWGAGSTGSRLVTGSTRLHADLEAELADFVGAGAGLVFSSGYLANLGVLTALGGPGGLIVSDALNHASVVDGARLARAEVQVVPHRDVAAVDRALSARTSGAAVVVTDAVFSVDGDLAPLADLHVVTRAHGALLVVDEAHSVGVVGDEGRGAVHQAGLAGEPDVVVTATLSKALGSQGGAVLADPVVVEHLVNTARPFIFDTALAPAAVGAAATALDVLRGEPSLAKAVRTRAASLSADLAAAGLDVTTPDGAVVSVLVGEPGRTAEAAAALLADGIRVGCFRPPSVPDGVSRLRLTARADLGDADASRAVAAVTAVLAR
jgi:8-amino-7-oxononanoate synthase